MLCKVRNYEVQQPLRKGRCRDIRTAVSNNYRKSPVEQQIPGIVDSLVFFFQREKEPTRRMVDSRHYPSYRNNINNNNDNNNNNNVVIFAQTGTYGLS